ncbi:transmembrane channel-like protein [Leptidea sinapis]|uniref:transmembrane channel-like protein n=1 Tax=Leptidea sinapis TaxID=189913 RepID=UPI0021C33AAE|nr:transmembrane channel-like protein [Leptidea sinapis]
MSGGPHILPSEATTNNEVKFSSATGDGSDDEDYSVSLSAVLRQRRASVRRSRKGRQRRSSSPFLPEETRPRRRSSVFTTSSGDTAISIEEQPVVTQEQIFENIHLHKEVLGSVKQQPLGMRRKLKIVHQAKAYIKRHEGQLQERLAQSKSTRDIYARFSILITTKWHQMKREAANTSNLLIPWELRIKEIESHFGSVVASYFTFLRWLFWVNLVIGFILLVFVIVPEYLTANPSQDGERKIIMEHERRNATNLLTLWEFEGILKYSPIFYGYYSNVERSEYKMPLAYFLTGLVVYVYSFVAILRKMAENSRMSKLSEKEDECIFSWKLFTGWDFMIGNAETAHNRIASVILGFKEALLEEAEKKKNLRNWRIITLRVTVNICVLVLLIVSAYAVVTVVSRSDDNIKRRSWWRENETTTVVTVISISFPIFFELLGFLEHYHPRKQLRLQLARIMLLNLLNLYSLIFALFSKIGDMSKELESLQPTLDMNASHMTKMYQDHLIANVSSSCTEKIIPCLPCKLIQSSMDLSEEFNFVDITKSYLRDTKTKYNSQKMKEKGVMYLKAENLVIENSDNILYNSDQVEWERIRNLSRQNYDEEIEEAKSEEDYSFYDSNYYDSTLSLSTTLETMTDGSSEQSSFFQETIKITDSTTNLDNAWSITVNTITDSDNIDTKLSTNPFENEILLSSSNSLDITSPTDATPNTKYADDNSDRIVVDNLDFKSSTMLSGTNSMETYSYDENTWNDNNTLYSDTTPSYPLTSKSNANEKTTICPNIYFNCTFKCGDLNITQMFFLINCKISEIKCFVRECKIKETQDDNTGAIKSFTDTVYYNKYYHKKMYNLTNTTRKRLLKLCWETMFGQELIKLTMMDLVFVLLGTLFMDFFRALFVRYLNRCWCWDLEKKFPEYGDFKIAENILHLINNQGMVWMGMFFSPGLVILNVFKLMIMMYLRSWAVMTCNVPHEVVFRVSKSNNFYLALLLTMLFLCVLPVGYTIVWVKPSWHCGPFSEYDKIYKIITTNIYKILPKSLNFTLEYIASPAIVIPLLVLLILIIYYLTSLTNSLREANNDLKIQLRRERTEERRKMFQLADTRRRPGSSSIDNTPFGRWKKALPSLPISKSIDSDDKKAIVGNIGKDTKQIAKKKGGILAKIVSLALDKKKCDQELHEVSCTANTENYETDTDFHESLPKDILKIKDITTINDQKMNSTLENETKINLTSKIPSENIALKQNKDASYKISDTYDAVLKTKSTQDTKVTNAHVKKLVKNGNSDSIGSVIPVITISTTESDEDILQTNSKPQQSNEKSLKSHANNKSPKDRKSLSHYRSTTDLKSLQRQNSFDTVKFNKDEKDAGHKYQNSL